MIASLHPSDSIHDLSQMLKFFPGRVLKAFRAAKYHCIPFMLDTLFIIR